MEKKNMLSAKNVKAKYKDELEALEAISDKGDGNVEVVNKRMEVVNTLQKIDKICSSKMAQKAKVKWSIEVDENTSFFHDDAVFVVQWCDVGGSMSQVHTWNEMVDRVKNRLSKWKMKTLSIGGINLLDFMHVKLGNGDKTAFWKDIWIEGKALKNRYPRIYILETCNMITMGMELAHSSLDSSFRRVPRGGVEQEQFDELSALVHDVTLTPMSDIWIWTLKSSGDFSVALVRKVIDDKSLLKVDSKNWWIKYVPIKVNVHAWKVKTDSLPTRFSVSRR
nr:RNA-directed DNA polymerase, eukaryota, reverse transcriptase zinc-binding domain protein [Tanacetum cinerariifolium]